MRWRTMIGGLGLLLGLGLYVLITGAIGSSVLVDHWAAKLIYFPVAGLLWIWPAYKILKWAKKDDD